MSLLDRIPGTAAWWDRRARELCHQTAERIQEIVDGEFPVSRKLRLLERHLAACGYCRVQAETIRQLKQAIARVGCEADRATVARLEDLARRLCQGPPADA